MLHEATCTRAALGVPAVVLEYSKQGQTHRNPTSGAWLRSALPALLARGKANIPAEPGPVEYERLVARTLSEVSRKTRIPLRAIFEHAPNAPMRFQQRRRRHLSLVFRCPSRKNSQLSRHGNPSMSMVKGTVDRTRTFSNLLKAVPIQSHFRYGSRLDTPLRLHGFPFDLAANISRATECSSHW